MPCSTTEKNSNESPTANFAHFDAIFVDHTEKEAAQWTEKEGGAGERGNVTWIWEPVLI